jgi:UDP-glucuronate 4-epimerase
MYLIKVIEKTIGKKAKINMLPMQPGDVPETFANIEDLSVDVGFTSGTSIEEGVARFIEWFQSYYTEHREINP